MKNDMPTHVGIILDGNGRWAIRKGLKRTQGHAEGYNTLKKISVYALKKGIKFLSVFAFSTENFKRSKEEVDFLMNLFAKNFKKEIPYFNENNIKVVFSGRKEKLSKKVLNSMQLLKESTKNNSGGVLNICLNYGGQSEIVDTTKKIVELVINNELDIDDLNENTYYEYLYNDLPPLDLLIRTSGEVRISNFMIYSLSYAEMYFTDICFPDFKEEEFEKAINSYLNRNITKGGLK